MFVSTKRQAREIIAEEAQRAGMPYVDERWLGGMLTNFKTVKQSIKRLKEVEAMMEDGSIERLSKREALTVRRELDKLQKSIGGIKDMGGLPDALFVIDVGYHKIAITEAKKLGIPVVAVVETNHSPEGVDYLIPGNDDSSRAIRLYARGVADAVLQGQQPGAAGNRRCRRRRVRRSRGRRLAGTGLILSEGARGAPFAIRMAPANPATCAPQIPDVAPMALRCAARHPRFEHQPNLFRS